jgi:hypothetical protein
VTVLVAAASDIALTPLRTARGVGIVLVVVDLQVGTYVPWSLQL